MTKKEAIKMLYSKMDGHTDTSYEWAETVRMAINALEQQPSDDCVSRHATLDAIIKELGIKDESYLLQSEKAIYNVVKNMPPVTPTHGTCKDCKNSYTDKDGLIYCCNMYELARFYPKEDFYCKDFEKWGNENG